MSPSERGTRKREISPVASLLRLIDMDLRLRLQLGVMYGLKAVYKAEWN
jgi:hypothetical protein